MVTAVFPTLETLVEGISPAIVRDRERVRVKNGEVVAEASQLPGACGLANEFYSGTLASGGQRHVFLRVVVTGISRRAPLPNSPRPTATKFQAIRRIPAFRSDTHWLSVSALKPASGQSYSLSLP